MGLKVKVIGQRSRFYLAFRSRSQIKVRVMVKVKVPGESSIVSKTHLYIRVSPAASNMPFRLTLYHVTFNLDPSDLCPYFCDP